MAVKPVQNAELNDILDRAYRYAFALSHNREVAHDLVQDVCLAVSRRGGPWTLPYLIVALRNRYIDYQRQGQRVTVESLGTLTHDIASRDALPSSDPGLEAALRQLSPEARDLLYLSVVEGYTAAALADMTERPRGTILSILHRTKQKLRRLLTEREDLSAL